MSFGIGAGALLSVGASLVGGMMASGAQADAAQGAADTSAAASRYSADIQKQMYDQTRADQTPWRDYGANAIANLHSGLGDGTNGFLTRNFRDSDFQEDPGYQFRLSEGRKAAERAFSSHGNLYSGRALKDATRFNQDLASGEYQNAFNRFQSNQTNQFNRLAAVAGVGQTANNALQQAGSNYANSIGNISALNAANQGNALMSAANARASGYQGVGTALGKVPWGSVFGGSTGSSGGGGNQYSDVDWAAYLKS